jgi:hypothetical protein
MVIGAAHVPGLCFFPIATCHGLYRSVIKCAQSMGLSGMNVNPQRRNWICQPANYAAGSRDRHFADVSPWQFRDFL